MTLLRVPRSSPRGNGSRRTPVGYRPRSRNATGITPPCGSRLGAPLRSLITGALRELLERRVVPTSKKTMVKAGDGLLDRRIDPRASLGPGICPSGRIDQVRFGTESSPRLDECEWLRHPTAMRLDPLFDVEIRFTRYAFARAGEGEQWICYAEGDGRVEGDLLQGTIRWSNRARLREDEVWLPQFEGAIATEDGAEVLFAFRGYNRSLELIGNWHWRTISGSITFITSDERYRWLNDVWGAVEGRGAWPEDEDPALEERWLLRISSCVNEFAKESRPKLPPWVQ